MQNSALTKEMLYDDEFITLYYEPSLSCIVKEWKKDVPENKFKEIIIHLLMQIVQTCQKYKGQVNLIADCRKLGANTFSTEVIDWLNAEVHKIYVMNKIQKKAFIASEDVMANLSIVSYVSSVTTQEGFTMNIFQSEKDAIDWIKS
ncbi:MAG: hypothetical protein SFU27_12025 [Thermonemataceae bacterium]|nr:hypothetical protein [Thermonemataceae bacterium]